MVEATGPGAKSIMTGDLAAYMNAGLGAYADRRNVQADKLVKLPDEVRDEAAATLLFKGPHRAVPAARNPCCAARRPVARAPRAAAWARS